MGRHAIETVMGAVVLLVAAYFLVFAYGSADLGTRSEADSFDVTATFSKVGGLKPGAEVRMSGIRIGSVLDQRIDPTTYQAVVAMRIDSEIALPADSTAAIASDGLLGGKYVNIAPGRAGEKLADGDALAQTVDFQSLEDMVSEIIFLATTDGPGR
ncbi:outer membrane lipid asymmetry maintenance protein MlaD [Roseospirillum parvum]|uniref:Phospholipid/cholesterol/gamma-HCH transport system substrate-binding protein n=1 Tax=Roseospirillum parvum TaxID=83401 RepID=A0A1G7ZYQ1_9PROT|nr:outer membrane lipid asymmetry maintenance protein MlaD [Roseospirillum parvum]SDH13782.1 phospholipid/cholesterol/gamma-HCH transport system substrate-binding protein [Roseospirillum parvum]